MRRITVILLCLIVTIGYSCKSSKQLEKTDKKIALEDKARFEALLSNMQDFNTFSSKVNAKIVLRGKSVRARGTFKMVRDEALQLSLQVLGFEAFRLYMTPDSMILIDKMNRRYIAEKTDKYLSQLPLRLHLGMLQSLFLNRPFLSEVKQLVPGDYKKFSYENISSQLLLKVKDEPRVSYGFYLNSDNLIECTEAMSLPQPSSLSLKWNYSQFEQSNGCWFPKRLDAVFYDEDQDALFELQLTYSNLQWNEQMEITAPSISSKYKRLNADALIKSLLK